MVKVLVTGHEGYVGTLLVPLLKAEGYEIVGLDTKLYAKSKFSDYENHIPSIKKDVRDIEAPDLEGIDAVIHLAGLCNDPLGDFNPNLTMEINHLASVRLAALSKEMGIERFIFSSSCSTYGSAGDNLVDETKDFAPVTPYGRSKCLVEQDVSKLADDSFSPTFPRSATAYGVSPLLRFDLVLNNLVAWAYAKKEIYLKSDGTPWRPLVHAEDMARAFVAILEAPRELVHNEAFNVGSENYRVSELAEIVSEIVPDCKITYAPDAGPDKRCYRVDCSKIADVLGFKSKWNVRMGVEELYNAYKDADITPEAFEGPRYKRIRHIEHLIESGSLDSSLRWVDEL